MEIWKLKEFWTVVIDLIVSTALYFGSKYLGEGGLADLKWVIAAIQPVTAFLVAHFAVERARVHQEQMIQGLIKTLGE